MIQKAIEKMSQECEKNSKKAIYSTLVYIEERYTGIMTDKIAEKILQDGKNLAGAYKHLESYAKGKSMHVMNDEDAFRVMDEYFGIEPSDYEADPVPAKASADFDIMALL